MFEAYTFVGSIVQANTKSFGFAGTRPTFQNEKEVPTMATSKEITIQMEDRPGTLVKFCRALANRRVNIVAFYSFTSDKLLALLLVPRTSGRA